MRRTILTAVAALGLLTTAATAFAQTNGYLPKGLSREDLRMVQAAAGHLAPEGPREDKWFNPKTGNKGTVAYVKSYKQKDMTCRQFRYTFVTGNTTDRTPYKLNWCRTPAGREGIVN